MTRLICATMAILSIGLLSALGGQAERSKAKNSAPPVRQELSLDFGWKFHLGDAAIPEKDFGYGIMESFAKSGFASGPARPDFDDSAWRLVNLPHDWAVELPFVNVHDKTVCDHGYKPLGRQFPSTSIGWYRRSFTIPKGDSANRIVVKFDGVFRDCTVWFNGFYLGRHFSGYSGFDFDVTDYVNFGSRNVLVVRVNATQAEGWFYEGAGIYRHVWLLEYAPLHIPLDGIFVTSTVEGTSASVSIQTQVFNEAPSGCDFRLTSMLLDADGKVVGQSSSNVCHVDQYEKKTLGQQINSSNPHLWSVQKPYLYHVVQYVESNGKVVDAVKTRAGIRTIRFDKDEGFFLNGKHVEIKGVCCHQDHAGVGTALPDGLQYFRIAKLKEMGCNAYRTSHNPPTPELLDVCDSVGMLVLDENRLMGSTLEITNEFKRLILRDRNHPSIIAWSIGNEEFGIESNETGARVARTLKQIQRRYDPSRFCTAAADNGDMYEGVNSVVDIRGENYIERVKDYDKYHREHPDQPMWGTEESSAYCTRGIYETDTANGYISDYDVNNPWWGTTAEMWWSIYAARPFLTGGFVWTGFDYRGEPTPYRWPDINSNFGIMDICGFPKNNFYYYQSWWSDKDVIHIFPHWNWKGKEGQPIKVWCFSNCDSVELILNGKSLGRKVVERYSHADWEVNYEPGTLEAVGWREGRELVTKEETTGEPIAIRLTPDRGTICADGEDVSVVAVSVVDSLNREVPTSNNLIHFKIHGEGTIIGIGNGDPSSHEPDKCLDDNYQRNLFSGKCEVILLPGRHPGKIELSAYGEGLSSDSVSVTSVQSRLIPRVE